MGDHYTRGRNRALAVWEIESGGLEIGEFSLPSDPGNQPQGQGNPRGGRSGWNPVQNPPPEKGPRTNQEGIPRATLEKGEFRGHPRGQGPPTPPSPPPPREQEEEGDKYIIQRRQFHPVEQTGNSDRRKRNAKGPSYEGNPTKKPSGVIRPCKTQGKRVASFWGLIWTWF